MFHKVKMFFFKSWRVFKHIATHPYEMLITSCGVYFLAGLLAIVFEGVPVVGITFLYITLAALLVMMAYFAWMCFDVLRMIVRHVVQTVDEEQSPTQRMNSGEATVGTTYENASTDFNLDEAAGAIQGAAA